MLNQCLWATDSKSKDSMLNTCSRSFLHKQRDTRQTGNSLFNVVELDDQIHSKVDTFLIEFWLVRVESRQLCTSHTHTLDTAADIMAHILHFSHNIQKVEDTHRVRTHAKLLLTVKYALLFISEKNALTDRDLDFSTPKPYHF